MKLLKEIIELLVQKDAPLSGILLKFKVLLHASENKELKGWVNDELKGYALESNLPPYRTLSGRVFANLAYGPNRRLGTLLPMHHVPEQLRTTIETATFRQSIAALEAMPHAKKDSWVFPLPPIAAKMWEEKVRPYRIDLVWMQIENQQIENLLAEVRSKLLDLALALQDEVGADMPDESAPNPTSMNESPGMFHGAKFDRTNVTVQIGNHNQQSVSITSIKGDRNALADELRRHRMPDEDISALYTAIDSDPRPVERGQYGPAIKGWMARMLTKAVDASWNIELGVAAGLLTSALQRYYGI